MFQDLPTEIIIEVWKKPCLSYKDIEKCSRSSKRFYFLFQEEKSKKYLQDRKTHLTVHGIYPISNPSIYEIEVEVSFPFGPELFVQDFCLYVPSVGYLELWQEMLNVAGDYGYFELTTIAKNPKKISCENGFSFPKKKGNSNLRSKSWTRPSSSSSQLDVHENSFSQSIEKHHKVLELFGKSTSSEQKLSSLIQRYSQENYRGVYITDLKTQYSLKWFQEFVQKIIKCFQHYMHHPLPYQYEYRRDGKLEIAKRKAYA